mmetsp:Transcript_2191/g.2278  ORF Transcript_2191/g.2278 Transcript_2191/m.2278 type:complete len:88 (-) Transcript_2191:98-361(-)
MGPAAIHSSCDESCRKGVACDILYDSSADLKACEAGKSELGSSIFNKLFPDGIVETLQGPWYKPAPPKKDNVSFEKLIETFLAERRE